MLGRALQRVASVHARVATPAASSFAAASPRGLAAAAAAAAGLATLAVSTMSSSSDCLSNPSGLTKQRKPDSDNKFSLADHYHGKTRVRILRVHREAGKPDSAHEYTIETRLFSPQYSKVFTHEDNSNLVATDTQKNTVYVVAKRSKAKSPERYGLEIAQHLLREYPMLTAVEVDVKEDLWRRHTTPCGKGHEHGFVREGPEVATAEIRVTREAPNRPRVISGFSGLTVLKTTQSGFENYLMDKFTLLPETQERCMATQMKVEWQYTPTMDVATMDFAETREGLRKNILKGFFGPPVGGVYSHSLQATIYDAGCLVLESIPTIQSVSIYTPNMHMIPFHALKSLGKTEKDQHGVGEFEDDVYVATSDPAGTIHCTVSR